ncbi:hypothetical protein Cst_c22950 [Thermoclostridium stercorarium subsp. stercorarium DSM 8532]|uniref:Uncharacterized protein n=2 Tax=Thermoclostridium stercorarium TaxID=1510 RepID=L7VM19_THES1|nr:hypothetical protein [Thermoclostridium stercorarium]AGC69255.1 hypothetical protein Cst_c22950 [Thermoclostridium stercorarium subsp. stercorarium DSM 8532]AGI40224.1 hypothetical protein Clst_2198 [Thermoclostridium stercorarium subsp. stercorarium DSM 8532]ANX02155.1 hypothetical protein CSTERLE_11530 [Thermoclostridium stercorarium subsp. leptospartum DSM 9219]
MERPGYFRKYVIFEQLDPGFGAHRSPDGFARLEGYRDGVALALQIRFLKDDGLPYTVILIYDKDSGLGVFRVGTLQVVSMVGSFRKFLDNPTLKSLELKPEKIKYILIASEQKDKIYIPLIACCKKAEQWDESLRDRLLHREKTAEDREDRKEKDKKGEHKENKESKENKENRENRQAEAETANHRDNNGTKSSNNKVDDVKLEKMLKDTFEAMDPFSNPRHDYSWYKVNDIAKLSNILYTCNLTIPLFANPKILVGLFKYRHLLAGFYRSDINNLTYFVLGVPAKDETDGKPFENVCRWVSVENSEFGDMTGYWLVYISLRDGEFVS